MYEFNALRKILETIIILYSIRNWQTMFFIKD